MIKKGLLFTLILMIGFILSGCSEVQKDYYEVHIIVVDGNQFHFINPDEGKDTISIKYMDNKGSEFIYLYQPVDGSEFSYDHFFSTINTHWVTTDLRTGKHYIESSEEIDTYIYEFFIEKDAWEASKS